MKHTLLFSFNLLLIFLFIGNLIPSLMTNPVTDIGCALVDCGQGTCKASNASLLGIDCECYPGWKKIQIGPLVLPPCIIPNCTIDFECGSRIAPLPPPAPLLPAINFSDPCALTWCGDGTCVANGTGHICDCNEGSTNLLNLIGLACFKQCSFREDCYGFGYAGPALSPSNPNLPTNSTPPPSPSNSDLPTSNTTAPSPSTSDLPTNNTSDSMNNGSSEAPDWSRNHLSPTIVLLAAIILSWV